ncbi:MAG: 50S ribosomal protein L18 [Nitrospirota bacterium]|nr:50S ribosomal protein L18 [Nitrospirota bacterium]
MGKTSQSLVLRERRRVRVRKKVSGSPERPRLVVFRSNRYIYAQVIDDVAGRTLAAASSCETAGQVDGKTLTLAAAGRVGELVAERARAQHIDTVVFDRAGYLYHGRVASLADGARKGGLQF